MNNLILKKGMEIIFFFLLSCSQVLWAAPIQNCNNNSGQLVYPSNLGGNSFVGNVVVNRETAGSISFLVSLGAESGWFEGNITSLQIQVSESNSQFPTSSSYDLGQILNPDAFEGQWTWGPNEGYSVSVAYNNTFQYTANLLIALRVGIYHGVVNSTSYAWLNGNLWNPIGELCSKNFPGLIYQSICQSGECEGNVIVNISSNSPILIGSSANGNYLPNFYVVYLELQCKISISDFEYYIYFI